MGGTEDEPGLTLVLNAAVGQFPRVKNLGLGDRQQHIANVHVRHLQVVGGLEVNHVEPLCLQFLPQLQQLGGLTTANVAGKEGAGGCVYLRPDNQPLNIPD